MLILIGLAVFVLGVFVVGMLLTRLLQFLSVLALVVMTAAGLGALVFGLLVGTIAALVLQATITAAFPLLSIAGGLAVALWVTKATLKRMLWEVRTAKDRLGFGKTAAQRKPAATPQLPPPPSR